MFLRSSRGIWNCKPKLATLSTSLVSMLEPEAGRPPALSSLLCRGLALRHQVSERETRQRAFINAYVCRLPVVVVSHLPSLMEISSMHHAINKRNAK